jgi:transposase
MRESYRFSDTEWKKIEGMLPEHKQRKDGKGRPAKAPRQVLEGIVWVLISGAPWHMLPKGEFPSYQTCHRYFQQWTKQGVIKKMLRTLSRFHAHGGSRREMHFIDGSFAAAKKGG